MKPRQCVFGVLVLTIAPALFAAAGPQGVSPGLLDSVVPVESRCPTFSWGAVPDAESYELVVYEVGEEPQAESEPALWVRLPGAAASWTPSLDRCLERGRSYRLGLCTLGWIGGWRGSRDLSADSNRAAGGLQLKAELAHALRDVDPEGQLVLTLAEARGLLGEFRLSQHSQTGGACYDPHQCS